MDMATLIAPDHLAGAPRPTHRRAAVSTGARGDDAVRRWLTVTAWSVVAVVVVGGITRLTDSGLSITVWEPVAGVLPPLSHADWQRAFAAYLQIPEAQTVHRGISLGGFQALYWWEWVHRLVARAVGLVIAVPYLWLLARHRIRPGLRLPLAALPVLVAAQGALGWYMVKSGLANRTDVSQYRLVAHLLLALVIFVGAVWGATSLGRGLRAEASDSLDRASTGVALGATALSALAFLTIASGGFVAGLDGGKVYNEFPLMGGQLVPREYGQLSPLWHNWFDNPVAAQFNHRVLAIVTLSAAWGLWLLGRHALRGAPARAVRRVAWVAVLQVALGLATLLWSVPIPVAALHQLGAVALLAAALVAANEARAATAQG